jgi:hypothetical protein
LAVVLITKLPAASWPGGVAAITWGRPQELLLGDRQRGLVAVVVPAGPPSLMGIVGLAHERLTLSCQRGSTL